MNFAWNLSLLLVAAGAMCRPAGAVTITGTVRDPQGRPVADAFVTAADASRKMARTVLTDGTGHFRLPDLFGGKLALTARKAGFTDASAPPVQTGEADLVRDLSLGADDDRHLSTPGLAWLNALPAGPMKAAFVSSCTICHDIGSPKVRGPRDAAAWRAIIQQMRGQADVYAVILKMDDGALADWLAAHGMGSHAMAVDPFAPGASVAGAAVIDEYAVGDGSSWAHDMAVEPATGMAWVGDYVKDQLTRVDPRTGEQRTYPAPMRGTGMHTLNFDRAGDLWITFQLADSVARFEPASGEWRIYTGFARGTLVHSFALDSLGYVKQDAAGRIVISQFGGNRVSLLDPQSGKITELPLPGSASGRPYGVAVDSQGRVWYTKYSENVLGFVDPASGQGREWTLPRPDSGPHRMHIDDDDNLWIPLSGYGTVLRYNTRTAEQREFTLPDADSFPYAARYDARSGRVWIAGNGANSIYALDPKTGKATSFRLPSYESYGRMISIDYTTGDVWTALSSYPNSHAGRDHGLLLRVEHALELAR